MSYQVYKWGTALLLFVVLVTSGHPVLAAEFTNPLGDSANDITEIINRIINFLLGLVGVLALLSLIWGGTLYIISFGNDEYVKQAKKIIFWAIVGLSVVILAFVILYTVKLFLIG